MPRLQQEQSASVTTTVELDLSTKAKTVLSTKLKEFHQAASEIAILETAQAERKREIEILFADEEATEALNAGVNFEGTPLKFVPETETTGKLNLVKLMKKFKLTPKQVDACRDEPGKRKGYLLISKKGA